VYACAARGCFLNREAALFRRWDVGRAGFWTLPTSSAVSDGVMENDADDSSRLSNCIALPKSSIPTNTATTAAMARRRILRLIV
jgi:hypothetical protein